MSMRSLEAETSLEAEGFGEDVKFLRALILDGRWDDAAIMLSPLRRSPFAHGKVAFELGKQHFLELLEARDGNVGVEALVVALKDLEGRCTQKEFHSLCFCLTLPSVCRHPDFTEWTVYRGRMWCFNAILQYLGAVFPGQDVPRSAVPHRRLEALCREPVLRTLADELAAANLQEEGSHWSKSMPQEVEADLLGSKIGGYRLIGMGDERVEPPPPPGSRHGHYMPRSRSAVSVSQPAGIKGAQQWEEKRKTTLPKGWDDGMHGPITEDSMLQLYSTITAWDRRKTGGGADYSRPSPPIPYYTRRIDRSERELPHTRHVQVDKNYDIDARVPYAENDWNATPPPVTWEEDSPQTLIRDTSNRKSNSIHNSNQDRVAGLPSPRAKSPKSVENIDNFRPNMSTSGSPHANYSVHPNWWGDTGSDTASISGAAPVGQRVKTSQEERGTSPSVSPSRQYQHRPQSSHAGVGVNTSNHIHSQHMVSSPLNYSSANTHVGSGLGLGLTTQQHNTPTISDDGTVQHYLPREHIHTQNQPIRSTNQPPVAWQIELQSGKKPHAPSSAPYIHVHNEENGSTCVSPARSYMSKGGSVSTSNLLTYSSLRPRTVVGMQATVVQQRKQPIRVAAFDPTGVFFATGSNEKSLSVMITPSLEALNNAAVDQRGDGLRALKAETIVEYREYHRGSVYCLAWDATSQFIATGSNDKAVKVVKFTVDEGGQNRASAAEVRKKQDTGFVLAGHNGTVRDVAFCPALHSSNILVSAGAGDFAVRVWDILHPQSPLTYLRGHTGTVYSVRFLPSGDNPSTTIITASADTTLRIWDTRTDGCIATMNAGDKEILAVAPWPGSDNACVTSHADGAVSVWDLRQRRILSSLAQHTEECRSLDFSPKGKWLVTAAFDSKACVYQTSAPHTCSSEQNSPSKFGGMSGVQASPGRGRVLDLQYVSSFKAHSGRVLCARWHPVMCGFLTTSADCSVMLWT